MRSAEYWSRGARNSKRFSCMLSTGPPTHAAGTAGVGDAGVKGGTDYFGRSPAPEKETTEPTSVGSQGAGEKEPC